MAIESIAKTLGTGSGVDITTLVNGLVEASFANKNAALTALGHRLTLNQEIGAATAVRILGGGRVEAAAETTRRGA